jgi:RNA polymerase sigma-70 factor (ECF subfamily)
LFQSNSLSDTNDIKVLEDLFHKWQQGLIFFANQFLRNEEEAREIVNDSFVAIWERRDTLNLDESIKGYLYKTVKNKCLNYIKKSKLEFTDTQDQDIKSDSEFTVLDELEAQETESKLNRVIESLPPKCKQIFLMSRKENMSYKEIASILDVTPKTVENQIGIALKHLKKQMFPSKGKKKT